MCAIPHDGWWVPFNNEVTILVFALKQLRFHQVLQIHHIDSMADGLVGRASACVLGFRRFSSGICWITSANDFFLLGTLNGKSSTICKWSRQLPKVSPLHLMVHCCIITHCWIRSCSPVEYDARAMIFTFCFIDLRIMIFSFNLIEEPKQRVFSAGIKVSCYLSGSAEHLCGMQFAPLDEKWFIGLHSFGPVWTWWDLSIDLVIASLLNRVPQIVYCFLHNRCSVLVTMMLTCHAVQPCTFDLQNL